MTAAHASRHGGGARKPAAPRGQGPVAAVILVAVLVSTGCVASRSRHYSAHLRGTIDESEPAAVDQDLAIAFGLVAERDTAIAAVDAANAWNGDR